MLITEKDIGCTITYGEQYYTGSVGDYFHTIMIIPKFHTETDSNYQIYSICLENEHCISDNFEQMVNFITEHFVPNYKCWKQNGTADIGTYFSDNYDVIFDVDEELFLYFKLKFCS